MKIDMTGRHVEITPALREFIEEKLGKLERLLDTPLEAHVVLSINKHRQVAEIQVKTRNAVLSGTEETDDLYASVGEVVDKLERQALRHKERMHDHRPRHTTRPVDATPAPAEQEGASDDSPEIGWERRA